MKFYPLGGGTALGDSFVLILARQHAVLDAREAADDGALVVVLGEASCGHAIDTCGSIRKALQLTAFRHGQQLAQALDYIGPNFALPTLSLRDDAEGFGQCILLLQKRPVSVVLRDCTAGVPTMPRKSKRSVGFEVGDKLLLPVEVTMTLEDPNGDPDLERVTLRLPGAEHPVTIRAKWLARALEGE